MVETVPLTLIPLAWAILMYFSHIFQYSSRERPELRRWWDSLVETMKRMRSGPHPFCRASNARSAAFSRMVTAVIWRSLILSLISLLRVDGLQQLIGVGELGHRPGVAQVGDFQPVEAGQDELFGDPEFGLGGDGLLLVLETVANADVAQDNFCRILHDCHFFALLPWAFC